MVVEERENSFPYPFVDILSSPEGLRDARIALYISLIRDGHI